MTTELDITAHLDQLDRLDRDLAAIRAAPPPLEARLAEARASFDAAAARFRAAPWSHEAGIRGAFAALFPKETARFELDRIRHRAAAEGEALDDVTRRSRISAAETEIAGLLASLSHADLAGLQQNRDSAHAVLRGLIEHHDELQARVDRRIAAMEMLRSEREAEPYRPADPPLWPGYDPAGQPRLIEPVLPPRPLTGQERTALTRQLADEAAALDRDKAALASAEAECNEASACWREAAAQAERCRRWLQRKPVTTQLAAE